MAFKNIVEVITLIGWLNDEFLLFSSMSFNQDLYIIRRWLENWLKYLPFHCFVATALYQIRKGSKYRRRAVLCLA